MPRRGDLIEDIDFSGTYYSKYYGPSGYPCGSKDTALSSEMKDGPKYRKFRILVPVEFM